MMRVLLWKEYREHRSIWLAMAALSALILLALFALLDPPGAIPPHSGKGEIIAGVGGSLLIIYGFVCGSIMLAGEYESGSVRFLDSLTGYRSRVWWAKTLAGTSLVLSQALCVCTLSFGLGGRMGSLPVMAGLGILIAICLGAFSWGMLGSALCRSVVMAAILALVLFVFVGSGFGFFMTFLWYVTMPESVIDNSYLSEIARAVLLAALPAGIALATSGLLFSRFDLDQRTSRARSIPKPKSTPWFPSWRVLLWLAFRQGCTVSVAIVIAGVMLGLMVPLNEKAMMIWLPATSVLGVLCGAGVFAGEQASGSYRFLGAQRLPAGRVWIAKTIFWLTAAVVAALFTLGGFCLHLALASDSEQHNWTEVGKGTETVRRLVPTGIFLMGSLLNGFCVGQFFSLVWRKSVVAIVASLAIAGALTAVWIPSLVAGGLHTWQVFGPSILLLVATRVSMWAWMADRLYSPRPAALLAGGDVLAFALLAWSIWYRQMEIPDVGEPFDVKSFAATIPQPEHNEARLAIQKALKDSQERQLEADAKLGPPKLIHIKQQEQPNVAKAAADAAEAVPDDFMAMPTAVETEIPVRDYYDLVQHVLNGEVPANDPQLGKWLDEVFQGDWMKQFREAVRLPLAVFIDPRTANYFIGDVQVYHSGYQTANSMLGRAMQLQSRKDDAGALDHIATVLALSRHFRNKANTDFYQLGLLMERQAIETLDRWARQLGPHPDLLLRAVEELTRHQAAIPPNDSLKADYLIAWNIMSDISIRNNYVTPGIRAHGSEKPMILDLLEFAWQVPWERNRLQRMVNLLFAGWFRGVEADYSQLLEQQFDPNQKRESHAWLALKNWLPPQSGRAASWTREKLCGFIDQSVLWNFGILRYGPVRVYSDFREAVLQGTRLQLALMLYQYQEKKPAPSLEALVPKYLPELPKDPFSGQSFRYRVSTGESIAQSSGDIAVLPGQGILWSVGPDGQDNGGAKQGAQSSSMDPAAWQRGGFDLIFLVPQWPRNEKE